MSKYFSYMAPESIVEGYDAGIVFPSFKSAAKIGEKLIVVANSPEGVIGYVIEVTNRVPNYMVRRMFLEKPEVRKRSPYEGLSGVPVKRFLISNAVFKLIEGGKVRDEDKPLIDAAISEAA